MNHLIPDETNKVSQTAQAGKWSNVERQIKKFPINLTIDHFIKMFSFTLLLRM